MHLALLLACQAAPVSASEVMEGAVIIDGVKVYIDPATFDSTRFLPPPPQGIYDSEDMNTVMRWQELRTTAMAEQAKNDSEQSVFR